MTKIRFLLFIYKTRLSTRLKILKSGVGLRIKSIIFSVLYLFIFPLFVFAISIKDEVIGGVTGNIQNQSGDIQVQVKGSYGISYVNYFDGPGYCSDGYLNTGEECDDGNSTNGDGCDSSCKKEVISIGGGGGGGGGGLENADFCGNGITDEGEECDDGNQILLDGCSSSCEITKDKTKPKDEIIPEKEKPKQDEKIQDKEKAGEIVEVSRPNLGNPTYPASFFIYKRMFGEDSMRLDRSLKEKESLHGSPDIENLDSEKLDWKFEIILIIILILILLKRIIFSNNTLKKGGYDFNLKKFIKDFKLIFFKRKTK